MKHKIFLPLFSALGFIFIILGGIHHKLTIDDDKKIFDEQEQRITLYLKYNTKVFNNITFTERDYIPIGSYTLTGYINNDKDMEFTAFVSVADNYKFDGLMTYTEKFNSNLIKNRKSFNQIEKEIYDKKHPNTGLH